MAAAQATRRAAGQAQPLVGRVGRAGGAGEDRGLDHNSGSDSALELRLSDAPLKRGPVMRAYLGL